MNKKEIIKTDRLVLKCLNNNDYDDLSKMLVNYDIKRTYMIPDFESVDELVDFFNKLVRISKYDDRLLYGIYLDNKIIGMINEVEVVDRKIELGYFINPLYQNKGYCTEVLIKMIDELFSMGFDTIKTSVFIDNIPSMKVCNKAGMKNTNEFEFVNYNGKEIKCVCFEIKKEDYEKENY